MPVMPTDLMTSREVAAEFGVAVKTVHRWVKAGKLPVARRLPGLRGDVLFDRAAIDELRAGS